MSEDKGKRRTSRAAGPPPPAEPPQVPEEATLPVAGFSLSETPADARELAAAAATAAAVAVPPAPVGAALQAESLATLLSGGGALGQFADVMPTFGNVLLSIGTGVAASQEAMDRSLVDTVRELQDTRITIVTDVIQELGDDGLPDVTREPTVVTEEVSLVNHVPPTQLLWDRVALSMDMTVSGISAEHGVVFRQRQTQAQGSAGSFWGFYDWFGGSASTREQTAQSRSAYEQQWASGQVRLDALLGSRRMDKLPVGAEVQIGPQISFAQGAVLETRPTPQVTRRAVDVTVTVRRKDGSLHVNQPVAVTSDPFTWGFAGTHTSSTDTSGNTVVTLYREYPSGTVAAPLRGRLTVALGEVSRTLDVTL